MLKELAKELKETFPKEALGGSLLSNKAAGFALGGYRFAAEKLVLVPNPELGPMLEDIPVEGSLEFTTGLGPIFELTTELGPMFDEAEGIFELKLGLGPIFEVEPELGLIIELSGDGWAFVVNMGPTFEFDAGDGPIFELNVGDVPALEIPELGLVELGPELGVL